MISSDCGAQLGPCLSCRPVIPKMANALRVLEIRIMPGERADFALPFEYLELLSPLRNLEELSVQVTGATNILEPFCTFPNLRILEVGPESSSLVQEHWAAGGSVCFVCAERIL